MILLFFFFNLMFDLVVRFIYFVELTNKNSSSFFLNFFPFVDYLYFNLTMKMMIKTMSLHSILTTTTTTTSTTTTTTTAAAAAAAVY
jgi:hypothetical protein